MVEPNHVRSICKIDCSTSWNELTISKGNRKKTEKRKQFAVLVLYCKKYCKSASLGLREETVSLTEVSNTFINDSLGIWYKYSKCIVLYVDTCEIR